MIDYDEEDPDWEDDDPAMQGIFEREMDDALGPAIPEMGFCDDDHQVDDCFDDEPFLEAAHRIFKLSVGSGAHTLAEICFELSDLGHFGKPDGCEELLSRLISQGLIEVSRFHQRGSPIQTVYGLPDDKSACRECGCIDEMACVGGCFWVEEDLCSKCAPEILKGGDSSNRSQR
jgi:hypothetical protein